MAALTDTSAGADAGINRVVVVDPTVVVTHDTQIADLTGNVSSAIDNRLSGLRNEDAAPDTVTGFAPVPAERSYWLQSFGSLRRERARGLVAATEQRVAGFVIGADGFLDGELAGFSRAGLFGGLAQGWWEPVGGTEESESQSFFGGGYASAELEDYTFDLILTAGFQDYTQRREVSNNLGNETGRADYSGWFVSPEVRMTKAMDVYGHRIEGNVSLRYAGLFLDGFTETEVASPLSVEDRTVHMGIARAELALPYQIYLDGKREGSDSATGTPINLRLSGGIELRDNFGGDEVTATLLDRTERLNPDGKNNTSAVFVGLSGSYQIDNQIDLNGVLEAMRHTDGSYQVIAQAGLRMKF